MNAAAPSGKLRAVWSNLVIDIKLGENIELYVLVVLSFALTIAGFFVGPSQGVAFAVGTLYVSQVIRERHRSAKLDDRVSRMIDTVEALMERIDNPELDLEVARMRAAAASPRVLPEGTARK